MGSVVRVVHISPSTANVPSGISLDEWRTTLTAAAKAWNVPCAAVRLEVTEPVQWWRATEDGRNLIVFRGESWCHNEQCGHRGAFPLRAMGMTTTYPDGARGAAVREADVELNAKVFDFTSSGETSGVRAAGTTWSVPLGPVLVHELGHLLGLGDACVEAHELGPKLARECPAEQRARAMFAPALLTGPAERDVAELCAIHPAQIASSQAPAVSTKALSSNVSLSVVGLVAFALGASLIFLRRRLA